MRLLVRMPRWVGDAVLAEPTLRALHAELGADLTLAGSPPLLGLLAPGLPRARRLEVGRRPEARSWRGHDAALLLDGSFASALAALRAGIPRRVGWSSGGRGPLLTEGLEPPRERGRTPLGLGRAGRWPRRLPRPFGASCVELAGRLGVAVGPRRPRLLVPEGAREAVRARRGEVGPYLVLQAGARPGSAKGHPPERWRAVLRRLRERGLDAPIFVLGGPGEESVCRAAAEGTDARVVADPVADLPELAAWCAEARLVLGCDGGPRHVAAAVGAPRVTLLGPTDPRHTTETRLDETLLRVEVPCGPCHRERCPLPGERHLACHTRIDPHAIAAAALRRW